MTAIKTTYAAAAVHALAPTATRTPYYAAFWRWDGTRMSGLHFPGGPIAVALEWVTENAANEVTMGRFILTHDAGELYIPVKNSRLELYHGDTDTIERDLLRLREAELASPKKLSMPADTRRQLRRMEGDRDTEARVICWSMAFHALRSVVAESREWVVNEHASWDVSTVTMPDPYEALSGKASSSSSPSSVLSVIPEASSSEILVF